ncbi:MAG: enoyl-CoA hydratase [Anaerolineales bacterium]|nr:enoyl-CoA hydratase [Anaerolineales bacterium]
MHPVLLEVNQNKIATLTINRPKARNALNWEAMHAFADAVESAHDLPDLNALIVTGKNGAFCAGGDLFELDNYPSRLDGARLAAVMGDALARLEELPCPTIAAIEGAAMGGGAEIALACDFRIMAESAIMGLVHIRLGISPAWGGGQRLLRLVGYARALYWITVGRVLSAEEAFRSGIANRITPDGTVLKNALEFLAEILQNGSEAIREIKRILRAGIMRPPHEAAELERKAFPGLWAAPAHLEASQRFVSKKKRRTQRA